MPLISVIIPVHNRVDLVKRAVASVLGQTFRDYELIIVDDGSEDNIRSALAELDGKIKVFSQPHRGVSAARNLGISRSSGELAAFLDSDDEWLPHKLERQLALFDPTNRGFVCHTDEIWIRNGKEVPQKKVHRKQGGRFFERALRLCLISPSSVVISRHLLDTVGWFDEELQAAEDYDLWLRVTAFHEVDFIPEPLVIKHGGHDDQLSHTIPAIDRFRIQAIAKILKNPNLIPAYREAAVAELVRKCHIFASGCEKRGRLQEAQHYRELAQAYQLGPAWLTGSPSE